MRNIVEQAIFEGYPLLKAHLTWTSAMNDPRFRGDRRFDREHSRRLDIAIHPADTGRIIVNYPGYHGDIDGLNDKYKKLSAHMQDKRLGAVVRSGNRANNAYVMIDDFRKMLEYTAENASEISGSADPEFYLMGASAGASVIAAVAHESPRVKRVLLFAPSGNAGETVRNLGFFKGEVYIVVGENDDVVGPQAGPLFYELAENASHRELFMLPNCDHQFRGTENGRIMSQAPFYAFAVGEKPRFPDPKGGIILY